MGKKVKIRLPKVAGEDPVAFVGINGKGYRIKRGQDVEVPEEVAEVLKNAEAAAEDLDKFNEEAVAKDGK